MKIAVRGGHNFLARGASALIDETTEDRKVKDSVIKYLNQLGHTVLDVTPWDMDSDSDLVFGVNKANSWGADLFISIHFNKAYNNYEGAIGTEAWVYSKNDAINDEEYAQRIVNSISGLGLVNRGVKERTDLYELKATKMASVIVEVCFVEATKDVEIYRNVGSDKIGQVIAEAISNKKLNNQVNNNVEKVEYKMETIVLYTNPIDECGAKFLAYAIGGMAYDAKIPFNFDGGKVAKRIIAVGGDNPRKGEAGQFGFTGYITHKIADGDRFDTSNVCNDLAKRISRGENIDSALNKYKLNK